MEWRGGLGRVVRCFGAWGGHGEASGCDGAGFEVIRSFDSHVSAIADRFGHTDLACVF
jgi:hypothetical protein